MPLNLSAQLFKVASRRQRNHTKPVRQSLHHRKALPPNRSRRTQYRYLFQGVLRIPFGVRRLAAAFLVIPIAGGNPSDLRLGRVDQYPIIPDNRNREDQRIDSVKYTAMPWQNASRILDSRTSLISRLQ